RPRRRRRGSRPARRVAAAQPRVHHRRCGTAPARPAGPGRSPRRCSPGRGIAHLTVRRRAGFRASLCPGEARSNDRFSRVTSPAARRPATGDRGRDRRLVRVRPLALPALVGELIDRIDKLPGPWVRVAVDGAPSAGPDRLADALVEALQVHGKAAMHIPAGGFLRAASLRLERGRTNPDAYYEDWLDLRALTRE